MTKLIALLELFRKGRAVANPEAWKKGQITATSIGIVILALVEVARAFFDVKIPLTTEQSQMVGAGVLVVVNLVLHIVRHNDVGLPARCPSDPGAPPDGGTAAAGKSDLGDSGGA